MWASMMKVFTVGRFGPKNVAGREPKFDRIYHRNPRCLPKQLVPVLMV